MPGFPRDLAVVDPWDASLERSRARRARAGRRRARNNSNNASSLAALLDTRSQLREERDLADEQPWELSLGRSRARRRAAELRFVPAGSRAKRISLGALAALTVGPTASLADGQAGANPGSANPEPPTTTEHTISLSAGSEGRQVEAASADPRRNQSGRHLRPGNRSCRARLPDQQGSDASTASWARSRARRCAASPPRTLSRRRSARRSRSNRPPPRPTRARRSTRGKRSRTLGPGRR